MTVEFLRPARRGAADRLPTARRAPGPIRTRIARHRLLVVAPDTVEAVRCTGGWLFDRVMAGWEVTVLTVDHTNSRPLRILGAGVADLEPALAAAGRGPAPHAIAVEVGLYESDARVRQMVRGALDAGDAEVWLWGNQWPAGLDGAAGPVQHRLSLAARAFKAQALAAASAPVDSIAVTELFHASVPPRALRTSGASRVVPARAAAAARGSGGRAPG